MKRDIQRREVIFKILDELKANGERINADKLARMAQMGKQTVLPFYNEWRFLDEADSEADSELPVDLVRTLKRGLSQWKHEATQAQRDFMEAANQEIDELQCSLAQQQEAHQSLGAELEKERRQHSEVQSELIQHKKRKDELTHELANTLAALIESQKRIEELGKQLTDTKKEHEEKLSREIERLDTQHQKSVDHWIQSTDNERRQRLEAERQRQEYNNKLLNEQKEKNRVDIRLENVIKAREELHNQLNGLKEKKEKLKQSEGLLRDLSVLMNTDPELLPNRCRILIQAEQQCQSLEIRLKESRSKTDVLREKVDSMSVKLDEVEDLKQSLEKEKGAVHANQQRPTE